MRKKTFLLGAAILGVSSFLVQVLGAVFRIPLTNIIGSEGMGHYQTVYPIYVFLLIFSTNGAPAAISKMVSERVMVGRHKEANRVFNLAFLVMFLLGLGFFAFFYFGARPLVVLMGNEAAYYCMLAIAPALLFVPVMAVFRGYFQGMQEMGPTAASQISEQAVRVAVGLYLAYTLLPRGVEIAAAGASFGTSVGPVVGVLVLAAVYLRKRMKGQLAPAADEEGVNEENGSQRESSRDILKALVKLTVPITVGISIMPIFNLADAGLVMNRLKGIGMEDASIGLYGQLSGMAGSIVNIPQAFALSIALSMVPAVTAGISVKDQKFVDDNIRLGFRTAMIIGVPCSFGLMSLAEPIIRLLYPGEADTSIFAASCLFYLGAGIIFLTVAQTMAGILQGLGKPNQAVYSLGAALLVKIAATYLLTGIPSLHVNGAAIASALAYLAVGLLNLAAVKRETGVTFDLGLTIFKPLAAGILMVAVVMAVYHGISGIAGNSLATVAAIGLGGVTYIVSLMRLRAIEAAEMRQLPKGDKLVRLLVKTKLIKADQ